MRPCLRACRQTRHPKATSSAVFHGHHSAPQDDPLGHMLGPGRFRARLMRVTSSRSLPSPPPVQFPQASLICHPGRPLSAAHARVQIGAEMEHLMPTRAQFQNAAGRRRAERHPHRDNHIGLNGQSLGGQVRHFRAHPPLEPLRTALRISRLDDIVRAHERTT